MTLGDKLSKLRKENNYTQEQLANVLGVSRQAISKWESNLTYPETDKLIRISELFECSLDYLLKDTEEIITYQEIGTEANMENIFLRKHFRERKSEKTIMGMPLWHVAKNANGFVAVGVNARGVIAIGVKAKGIVSLGVLAMGVLSLGMLSLGLISLGMIAFGILAAGSISLGIFATGAICFGVISLGAISIGEFSVGALSVGKYFSLGDNARAMIAVGDTKAMGSIFQKTGNLTVEEVDAVKKSLDTIVPAYLSWANEIIKMFL